MEGEPATSQWEKVLYKKHGLPDNYTDAKFLQDFRRNANVKQVSFATAVWGAGRVSTQICLVVIFWCCFLLLEDDTNQLDWPYPRWLAIFGPFSLLTVLAYGFQLDASWSDLLSSTKDQAVVLFLLYTVTPILKTLTETFSTDTVYAMNAALLLAHLVFHNYGVDAGWASHYVSLNAAICSSICLSSRLAETHHVFVLCTMAIECFVVFPELYRELDYSTSVLGACALAASCCLYAVAAAGAVLLLAAVLLFVNVASPSLFVWAQKYKDNKSGPWDEAQIFFSQRTPRTSES